MVPQKCFGPRESHCYIWVQIVSEEKKYVVLLCSCWHAIAEPYCLAMSIMSRENKGRLCFEVQWCPRETIQWMVQWDERTNRWKLPLTSEQPRWRSPLRLLCCEFECLTITSFNENLSSFFGKEWLRSWREWTKSHQCLLGFRNSQLATWVIVNIFAEDWTPVTAR